MISNRSDIATGADRHGRAPGAEGGIKSRLPPGPKGHLLKGNLPEFSRDPLGFMTRCAREYGDVVGFRFVNVRGCFLNHPDHVEYVLATHNRKFKKGRALQWTRRVLGNGLLTSEGDVWLRQRRLAQPAFHKDRIDAYGKAMVIYTERMLAGWRDGETIDLHPAMMRLTLAIVSKTLFDAEVSGEATEVGDAVRIFMEQFVGMRSLARRLIPESFPTPRNRRYRRALGNLDEIIYRIIRRHQAGGNDAGDLLSILLSAKDEDGSRMTDQQLRDEVLTIFLAGHETTAVTLTWAWYLLAAHPEVEGRLHDELKTVLGGRAPGVQDLRRLSYLERLMKETMRLYPPAYVVGREALTDFTVGGYAVRAGTQILMSQWTIHRDPRFYEEAERFNPDRWTNDFAQQLHKYAYFPFGGGPRLCIGSSFASMEVILVMATMAQRFRVAFPSRHVMTPVATFTLRPKESPLVELRIR